MGMKSLYLILCFLFILFALLPSCTSKFVDTTTPGGVPNLVQFAPNMWRMGQPPDAAAWKELASRIAPNSQQVVIVKLDDEVEGSDDPAEAMGWQVVRIPMPPEDDKVWTVLVKPNPTDVQRAVDTIVAAHAAGKVVAWHCVHGRDRTGLISALVGMKLFGWTKDQAWSDMLAHGFRWELPDLDAYWLENVPGRHL
jgi:protein-tyrosine phosphatase